MEENKKINIKDGLSIDEAKVSVLIILCILSFLYAFVMYALNGDISNNLSDILTTLVFIIGGVNIGNKILGVFDRSKNISK